MARESTDVETRFWSKVVKDGPTPAHRPELGPCWLWTGAPSAGYGRFWDGSRRVKPHRYAVNAPAHLVACHHCDTPLCVRRSHIFLGTRADNNRDRHLKGRDASHAGTKNGRAKLTRAQVAEIRAAYKFRVVTYADLAKQYGVCQATVSHLVHRRNWAA